MTWSYPGHKSFPTRQASVIVPSLPSEALLLFLTWSLCLLVLRSDEANAAMIQTLHLAVWAYAVKGGLCPR